MGTASYMSPEQVRGEKVDTRTDLFSFGLVLYEMATGQEAFAGQTAALVHDAILRRTPVPARELNPQLPPKVEQIINKALEKDRERRYQRAAELRADFEDMQQAALLRRPWRVLAALSALVLLFVVAGILWFARRQPPSPLELKQRQLTTNSSENAVGVAAISPDGRYLAYTDLRGIHLKLLETGETQTIPRPETINSTLTKGFCFFRWSSRPISCSVRGAKSAWPPSELATTYLSPAQNRIASPKPVPAASNACVA